MQPDPMIAPLLSVGDKHNTRGIKNPPVWPCLVKPKAFCSHPEKIAFPTASAAMKYHRRRLRRNPEEDASEAYRCACGKFHLSRVRPDEETNNEAG